MMNRLLRFMGAYSFYERWLSTTVSKGHMPNHIAVILDGNRRWASMSGLAAKDGYRYGAQKIEEMLDWCLDLGVRVITLYALSLENMQKRSRDELDEIYRLLVEKSRDFMRNERVWRYKARFKVIGRKWLLPERVRVALEELERATSLHDRYFVNVAVAYGGRAEIVDAIKKIGAKVKNGELELEEINEELVEKNLYTNGLPHPFPDLVIRTSGEERISNFLLWQLAYSELVFLDVHWPEFRRIDLLRAIRTYQQRNRRFGA